VTKNDQKSSFTNDLNSAVCVPINPKVWEYDEFNICTIVERTEIIIEKLTSDLDEFVPRIN